MARHFQRSQKKAKLWVSIPSFEAGLNANATTVVAGFGFTSPQTVIRMLGEYLIAPSAAPTAFDRCKVTVGLAKVSTDAFTLGSTAMPDPAEETSFPWLYWAEHHFNFTSAALTGFSTADVLRRTFDIRTMRKFTSNETLCFIMQYTDIQGTPALRFQGSQTRTLTTLH